MRIHHLLILFQFCKSGKLLAQTTGLTQTMRGTVLDRDSRSPISGATITIADAAVSTLSDTAGNFILRQVPVGRQKVQVSVVGYQLYVSDYIIVYAAKEVELQVELSEEKKSLGLILVTGIRNPKLPVNKFAMASGRSFFAEGTQRFATRVIIQDVR